MEAPSKEQVFGNSTFYPHGSLFELLNQEPKPEWIKEHDLLKGHYYLPIENVELLLDRIFPGLYKIEITGTNIVYGIAFMELKLHYFNYDSDEWSFHSGSAAMKIGSDVDATFQKLRSEAIKSAAKLLGRIFGRDLRSEKEPKKIETPEKWKKVEDLFEKVQEYLPTIQIAPIQNIILNRVEAKRIYVTQQMNYYDPEKKKPARKKAPVKTKKTTLL